MSLDVLLAVADTTLDIFVAPLPVVSSLNMNDFREFILIIIEQLNGHIDLSEVDHNDEID